jgi:hypothetical protein
LPFGLGFPRRCSIRAKRGKTKEERKKEETSHARRERGGKLTELTAAPVLDKIYRDAAVSRLRIEGLAISRDDRSLDMALGDFYVRVTPWSDSLSERAAACKCATCTRIISGYGREVAPRSHEAAILP